MGIDHVQLIAELVDGARVGYCSVAGDTWQDGTPMRLGTFLDLEADQPEGDPHYAGATVAILVEGRGITCDAPPVGYSQRGAADPYAAFAP